MWQTEELRLSTQLNHRRHRYQPRPRRKVHGAAHPGSDLNGPRGVCHQRGHGDLCREGLDLRSCSGNCGNPCASVSPSPRTHPLVPRGLRNCAVMHF